MSEVLDVFIKFVLPIILALVTLFSACKEMFLTRRKVYEEREKLSKNYLSGDQRYVEKWSMPDPDPELAVGDEPFYYRVR